MNHALPPPQRGRHSRHQSSNRVPQVGGAEARGRRMMDRHRSLRQARRVPSRLRQFPTRLQSPENNATRRSSSTPRDMAPAWMAFLPGRPLCLFFFLLPFRFRLISSSNHLGRGPSPFSPSVANKANTPPCQGHSIEQYFVRLAAEPLRDSGLDPGEHVSTALYSRSACTVACTVLYVCTVHSHRHSPYLHIRTYIQSQGCWADWAGSCLAPMPLYKGYPSDICLVHAIARGPLLH